MQTKPIETSILSAQALAMAEEIKRCQRWPSHRPSFGAVTVADDVLHMIDAYGPSSAKRAVAVLAMELNAKVGDGEHCTGCGKFIPSGDNWDCHADDCSWAASQDWGRR